MWQREESEREIYFFFCGRCSLHFSFKNGFLINSSVVQSCSFSELHILNNSPSSYSYFTFAIEFTYLLFCILTYCIKMSFSCSLISFSYHELYHFHFFTTCNSSPNPTQKSSMQLAGQSDYQCCYVLVEK